MQGSAPGQFAADGQRWPVLPKTGPSSVLVLGLVFAFVEGGRDGPEAVHAGSDHSEAA